MSEPNAGGNFQRRLSLFDATMLVAGTMIGSGIFIVSSDIARDVGSSGWLLVVWILTGVMTLIGALCYAELAAMMPHAGGQYIFLREAYSPLWGFLYGWTCFTVIQTGSIAAVAVAFAKFLGVIVPELGTEVSNDIPALYEIRDLNWKITLPIPWMDEPLTFFERKHFTISRGQGVAVFIVALLTGLNCRGVQEGKWVQNVFTILKTGALILLIVLGVTIAMSVEARQRNFSDLWSGIADTSRYAEVLKFSHFPWLTILLVVCAAMVGSLFSADAWNNVTFIAGEMKEPKRDLPRSLALGTILVIALYLLANYAYISALPLQGDKAAVETLEAERKLLADAVSNPTADQRVVEIDKQLAYARGVDQAKEDRVGTAIFQRVSPNLGVYFMAVAIMISTFGCVNGMILMGARLYYAMAQDRLFFAAAGTLNPRGVPAIGLVLQGLWSIALIFTGSYNELLDYVIFAVLFFYVLTVAGLFILRRKLPNVDRPYRAIGYPVLPFLYVVMCAVIMLALLFVKPVYSWPSFLLVLSGIPIYFLWRGRPDQSMTGSPYN
jgi:basic amino acid/polyamine antiporter, APA family